MTTLTADRSQTSTAEGRLRTVLRVDAVVTGLAGVFAVVGPTSSYGDVPGWLPRTIGAVFAVTGAALFVSTRASGERLRTIGSVCAGFAVGWVVTTVALLELVDLPARGQAILATVGAATLVFAVLELRSTRTMRSAVSRR
jgi:peptidoglycan/LPS O-acetylase OafA/YrhL